MSARGRDRTGGTSSPGGGRGARGARAAPGGEAERRVVYCIVPDDLADKLHEPLRHHFRDDQSIEVVIERRLGEERRSGEERRAAAGKRRRAERRRVRNPAGRRAGERRATLVPAEAPELPRKARRYADRLLFLQRLEPAVECREDRDTARLVTRFQAGDREAFADLYLRYYDRVYAYLRVVLRNQHDAEDAAQQVFLKVLEALPRYERRRQPFSAWLFVVVRNQALADLAEARRTEPVDPAELDERREGAATEEEELPALNWITDTDLLVFIGLMPLPQRQALVLRYMLDLPSADVARILGRTPADVRQLQSRAVRFLRERLKGVGRESSKSETSQSDTSQSRAPVRHSRVARNRRFALL